MLHSKWWSKQDLRLVRYVRKMRQGPNPDSLSEVGWELQRKVEARGAQVGQKRRRGILSIIKHAEGCAVCGEDDPTCLDFHHLDPAEKTAAVATMCNWAHSDLWEELSKCEVLCSNCHRKGHHGYHETPAQAAARTAP